MPRPIIRIEGLHYAYPPVVPGGLPVTALRGIDLEVAPGEFLAVMGPTGAGKTTLCLALNGLVPHATGGTFRGDVWVRERNTKSHPVAALATEVGLVFQDAESQLFNMTVEDEVAFGPESLGLPVDEIERRLEWALDAVGLAGLRARSPASLSGGQQRRLAIAAVLAMHPSILVLDEPTAGLDPLGRREVLRIIAALRRRGTTVIMATQDADAVAELADRVIVLEAGHIALEGTPQEVFAHVERLHALGVDVPQMAELSHRLGIHPPCLTVEQAARALTQYAIRSSQYAADELRTAYSVPTANCNRVVFHDVWFRYETGVQALAGVALTLGAGEYVALIGANGSGKTTLAKHVNGLLRPQRGRVCVIGHDVGAVSTGELARHVGYVFQNPDHQLFAPSVWEEIAFGPRNLGLSQAEVEARVEAALTAFDLTPLADVPPATLGYGQRRLVTLAAVHAMQPQVLILDEPTVGLDRRLTQRLLDWVAERHAAGTTVVFITHDMRLAPRAARCLVMHRGQILLDASTAEAFAQPQLLEQAGIVPPPIVMLGQRLGLPDTPLTVEDFCRRWVTTVGA